MSWIDKFKDHVGSGITSASNTSGQYTLSQTAKDAITRAELQRLHQQQADMLLSGSVYPTPSTKIYTHKDKILMRLDLNSHYGVFDFIEAACLNEDRMAVFVVTNGKHVTLEDDAHLFPSDTLITQLRLLRK